MSTTEFTRTGPSTTRGAVGRDLVIPPSLQQQLIAFRNRVWTIKMVEAIAIVMIVFGLAFLAVYAVDRLGGMNASGRAVALGVAVLTTAIVPWVLYRWVWRHRGLEPTAQLLGKRLPAVGDQLLGVIELSRSKSEQARSPALCQAAMDQVAADAAHRDFRTSTPPAHPIAWASLAGLIAIATAGLAIAYPDASANAFARLTMPWRDTPRYTFTRIDPVADNVVVAHGESSNLAIRLNDASRWQPESATLQIGAQAPITASLQGGQYEMAIPPQITDQAMTLRVGDVTQTMNLEPMVRPELSAIGAEIRLPEYLGKPEPRQLDSRAGSVSILRGSVAKFTATANRDLASGSVNAVPRVPEGASIASDSVDVSAVPAMQFQWQDQHGLAGREPFDVAINAIDDEAPTLICDGLERIAVVLDSETLKFSVRANDDYGVRNVGISWRPLPGVIADTPAIGERPLAAGGHDADSLDAVGTFSAKTLGIEPQPIELFAWAEDYLPGRERVYSPPHILYILTPDQHAIWMTEQLSKWHRQALDVRDRERQLFEKNKQLRDLSPEELSGENVRREIQRQASAETSNARRLERLGEIGDSLVVAARRNPEIGVGHLERWAEMLQVLKDLSENRMPSVADLLDDSAQGPAKIASSKPSVENPKAGQSRAGKPGGDSPTPEGEQPKLRAAPTLADMESSANSPDELPPAPGKPSKPSSPSLRLPTTTVIGKNQKPDDKKDTPQDESMNQAVEEQEGLLAEFDKLADELNAVLANLEGSTLVKRLKAESRKQNVVAGQLTEQLESVFGLANRKVKPPLRDVLNDLRDGERASTQNVSYIMDDLSAYFERRRFAQFKEVLDEMKSSDVIGGLRSLADEIITQQGISVAQAEYWSDTMDRWAETLVDPACSGTCPGGKSPESLPPSIVLEVLQILEAEIDLREETRVAQQAQSAVTPEEYITAAEALSKTQAEINERVVKVTDRILELDDATKHFGKELKMLADVDRVMTEATAILAGPETGAPAIAAETEAIELILRSKRINPKGGGGGGSSPGGGGKGTTNDSALALVGKGTNQKAVRQERGVTQMTGDAGAVLPEEYRKGLDQYFNRIGGS